MRTTVTLDDTLLDDARELSGIQEVPALIRFALQSYVQREAASQLARMGGTEPGLKAPPRRRPPRFLNDDAEINDRQPVPGHKPGHAAE
ncbi:MAG: type II toxin-antitoxin system VapB family antitoxin [Devosia sp.]|nr:type II toxin-antitoxin system VapB family antitoxin [Devosia sp.]